MENMEQYIMKLEDISSWEYTELEDCYDIEVEDNHNFYLSTNSNPILVSNSGKSAVLDQILIRLASRCNWKHAILSREQWPHDLHVTKMIQIFSGKGLRDNAMTDEIFDESMEFLDEHFFLFGIKELTVKGIIEKARQLVLKHGIKSLTIDPWNTLTHDKSGSDSETDYVNEVLKEFVAFKDMYSVHVFLVAHPKKMQYEGTGESKKLAMPGLYDIAGSSNFYNVMDNGLVVYRNLGTRVNKANPLGDTVTLSVQKVRNFFIGQQGAQVFDYNYLTGVYSEEHADFESELAYWKFKNKKIDALPIPIKYDKEVPTLTDISKLTNIKTSFDDYTAPTETIFKFADNGELKPNTDIETPF